MEQQLNFYLDLKPGERADLEVVSRASISFANAVREIAYIIDPSLVIRLEYKSGTEGSLSVNSVVKFIRQQVADPVVRKTIIVAVLFWFAKESGAALLGIAINDIVADEPTISEHDAEQIAEKVQELLEQRVGSKHVQDVYREVKKDKSISGIGVGTRAGERPQSIVPREEFEVRSRDELPEESEGEPRTRTERMVLTLISPVLQDNNNKWRFLSKDGNIYVGIKDKEFLSEILSGKARIPMKSGIVILADVEVTEKFVDEVWQVTDRHIVKVRDIKTGDDMNDLFFSQGDEK